MNILSQVFLKKNNRTQDLIASLLFLTVVPILAHLLFSWMGFCPTDDGLNLAFSRRLLDGLVPHRDFINIRPIGSALLHAPFVLLGGNSTFWIDRLFTWFEFSCIAWIWTTIIVDRIKLSIPAIQKIALAAIAFVLTTHIYLIMASHTVDGLLFLSLGLGLYYKKSSQYKFAAYSLMGTAYLFKQSFLPPILGFFFILGDWRMIRYWFAASMPGIFFLIYLSLTGAIPDAILQLSSRGGDLYSRGIVTYLHSHSVPFGILLGYFAMTLLCEVPKICQSKKFSLQRPLGVLLLYSIPIGFAIAISQDLNIARTLSFGLFGTTVGTVGYLLLNGNAYRSLVQMGLLIIITGWGASLSIGYNIPALLSGPFAVLLVSYCHYFYQPAKDSNHKNRFLFLLFIFFLAVSIASYLIARHKFIYQDRNAQELTKSLDGVFPGMRFIKTNSNTYEFLLDFKTAVKKTAGWDFAVIPGLAGYWAKAPKKNPLPIDWAINGEMSHNKALTERVLKSIKSQRGSIVIILENIIPRELASGFLPRADDRISQYVRTHFTKTGKTRFFELYQ